MLSVGHSQSCFNNFLGNCPKINLPHGVFFFFQDVALFEMNQSHSKEEDSSEENSQDSSEESSESEDEDDSTSSEAEVTIDNIKLPHSEDGKGKIEVLDSPASENKEKQGSK